MSAAAKLRLDQVRMTFKTPTGAFEALAPVTLAITPGRFVSLIGPSGCGKSTIFNIIAGLLEPTAGRVLIDGVDATGTIGRVGYMLQKDLLLPWRTVLDNTVLGMEIQGVLLREARHLPVVATAAVCTTLERDSRVLPVTRAFADVPVTEEIMVRRSGRDFRPSSSRSSGARTESTRALWNG